MTILHVYFGVNSIYPIKREDHYSTVDLLCKLNSFSDKLQIYSIL